MLAQLKRASRRTVALIWAMALAFALAPAVAMANATGAGEFSRFLVHAHADGDAEHVHHGHHHHAHDEDADHYHHDPVADGVDGDPGQPRLHVHFDVCCPSVLVPAQVTASLHDRIVDRVTVPRVEPLQGAPPGLILRPPIPSSLS